MSIPQEGFESAIPGFERVKTVYALDRTTIVIGLVKHRDNFAIMLFSTVIIWRGFWAAKTYKQIAEEHLRDSGSSTDNRNSGNKTNAEFADTTFMHSSCVRSSVWGSITVDKRRALLRTDGCFKWWETGTLLPHKFVACGWYYVQYEEDTIVAS
jgi:hypothetical protein